MKYKILSLNILGIISLFLIFLTFISCSSENKETIQVLSFKNCKVSYPQFSKGEKSTL